MRKILSLSIVALVIQLALAAQITTDSRWILKKGGLNGPTSYGIQGVTSPTNNPDGYGQDGYVTWKDNTGNFWIFGCNGFNDLWKFEPSTNNWTWMKGSHTFGDVGNYGIKGVPSASNNPSSRSEAVGWTDPEGNLYLFGGGGFTSNGNGFLNDLWKYDHTTNNWTWIHGDNSPNQISNYGTPGIPAASNKPGSRLQSMAWTDENGYSWLLGGNTTGENVSNDLWKYDPSSNEWTCVQLPGPFGYTIDRPSRRQNATTVTDEAGNLWLFGGFGYPGDFPGLSGLHDLWKYDPLSGAWSLVKGSSSGFAVSVYGTKGVESSSNTPGARQRSSCWSDGAGNIWVFGGYGIGAVYSDQGYFNDLWKFDPITNNWTWILGTNQVDQPTHYAQNQCEENILGGRAYASNWKDDDGNFWLFGGHSNTGYQDVWKLGSLNDLPPGIINLSVTPSNLWPPNHTMRNVTVAYTSCFSTNCTVSVTSNEPQNGLGDGDKSPDWEIVNDNLVNLRSERSENGTGRIYTIRVTCQNSSGATTSATATVTVQDNQSSLAFLNNNLQETNEPNDLTLKTLPNPSRNYFTLNIQTNDKVNPLIMRVYDMNGRTIETKQNLVPDQTTRIGASYQAGIYLVQIIQGNRKISSKLIKIE